MLRPKGCAGSSPASGTKEKLGEAVTVMRARASAVLLVLVAGLTACAGPTVDAPAEFGAWASAQEYVASVDTGSASGLTAHIVVEGAIGADELSTLSEAALTEAAALGASSPSINLIVGNAWGFSVDAAGAHVATINTLRDDRTFVGATVEYEALNSKAGDTSGLRGIVGSQAALRDAYAALVTAMGDDVDGLAITATTADGAFAISGSGPTQPEAAIALWQAISGRVLISEATASPEGLDITVPSPEDQVTAEAIGTEHPDVALTVHEQPR